MRAWFRRKRGDLRHAVQEFRAGDAIGRGRSPVRMAVVGGQTSRERARAEVPMGIERVLRKAASDERFARRLLADRGAALDDSGLALTSAERAILTAASDDQLGSMIHQLAPASPGRRGLLRRLATAAAIAVFGSVVSGCRHSARNSTAGASPEELERAMEEFRTRDGANERNGGWAIAEEEDGSRTTNDQSSGSQGVSPEASGVDNGKAEADEL